MLNAIGQERKIEEIYTEIEIWGQSQESCFEHSKFESLYTYKQRATLCGFI